jgi:hypothetical protein
LTSQYSDINLEILFLNYNRYSKDELDFTFGTYPIHLRRIETNHEMCEYCKHRIVPFLLILLLALLAVLSKDSFSQQKEKQSAEGQILCVENGEQEKIEVTDQIKDCDGVYILMGNDGKTYTVIASEEDLRKYKSGEQDSFKVDGKIKGTQRAWIIDSTTSPDEESSRGETRDIEGDIFCLLPYYTTSKIKKSTLKPILSSYPCHELAPHPHVLRSKNGEIYSIFGSEEKISEIERNPKDNVLLKGKVKANDSGLLLYVF